MAGRRRGRTRLAFAGAVLVLVIAAAAAVASLPSGSPDSTRSLTTASAGPLRVMYGPRWHPQASAVPGRFAVGHAAIVLADGAATLVAGPLAQPAPVPGVVPPALVQRFGRPSSSTAARFAGHRAKRYQWTLPGDRELVAFVLPTAGADLALVCAGPAAPTAALSGCEQLAPAASVTAADVIAPGADARLASALAHDLAPVSAARASLHGLSQPALAARAGPARHVAQVERSALTSLNATRPLARNRSAVATLRSALAAEASAFAALAGAASSGNRVTYGTAVSSVEAASRRLAVASATLHAQDLATPPLPVLSLAPAAAAPVARHAAVVVAPAAPAASGSPASHAGATSSPGRSTPAPSTPAPSTPAPSTPQPASTSGSGSKPTVVVVPTGSKGKPNGSSGGTVVRVPTG